MGKIAKAGKKAVKQAADDEDDFLDMAVKEAGEQRSKANEFSDLAYICAAKGDADGAIKNFTEAIAADPNSGLYLARRSAVYLQLRNATEALADAKKGASQGAANSPEEGAECQRQLGDVHSAMGQLQYAREAFEKGLRLKQDHAGCRQGLDEVLVLIERKSHSGTRAAVTAGPDDLEAQRLGTLPTPEEVLGRGFEIVRLKVGSCDKPLKFLLSTTQATEMVMTPAACAIAGLPIKRSVDLPDVRFEGGKQIGAIKDVAVSGFLQAQIADKALNAKLDGMVGLPFLARFDLDLDRVRAEQRFKAAGAAAEAAAAAGKGGPRVGVTHLPGMALPGGGIGLPVRASVKGGKTALLLGLIDTSSMFSVMNWEAARALGVDGPEDDMLENATKVVGPTKAGPAEMPLVGLKVRLLGAQEEIPTKLRVFGITKEQIEAGGTGKGWFADFKGRDLKPEIEFGRVNAAIGEAIQLELLRDSAVGEYAGGVVVLGQDVLAQAPRLTLSAKDKQIYMDAPGRVVDAVLR